MKIQFEFRPGQVPPHIDSSRLACVSCDEDLVDLFNIRCGKRGPIMDTNNPGSNQSQANANNYSRPAANQNQRGFSGGGGSGRRAGRRGHQNVLYSGDEDESLGSQMLGRGGHTAKGKGKGKGKGKQKKKTSSKTTTGNRKTKSNSKKSEKRNQPNSAGSGAGGGFNSNHGHMGGRGQSQGSCFKCQQPGHFAANCPQSSSNNYSSNNASNPSNGYGVKGGGHYGGYSSNQNSNLNNNPGNNNREIKCYKCDTVGQYLIFFFSFNLSFYCSVWLSNLILIHSEGTVMYIMYLTSMSYCNIII